MSGRPRKTVRVSPHAQIREYNFLNQTTRVGNASRNRMALIVNGKNARGNSTAIPAGNTRRSPMYFPNRTGTIFKTTNAMTANKGEFREAVQRSKESLRVGENVPTIHQTRRALSRNEAINQANRKLAMREHATYRNTGKNISPLQNYRMMEQMGENMENIIRAGEQGYIASGLENVAHARRTAEINERDAVAIAAEAASPLRHLPGSRNLLGRRPVSARKTRKTRRV